VYISSRLTYILIQTQTPPPPPQPFHYIILEIRDMSYEKSHMMGKSNVFWDKEIIASFQIKIWHVILHYLKSKKAELTF
jgi:hypothetical protein